MRKCQLPRISWWNIWNMPTDFKTQTLLKTYPNCEAYDDMIILANCTWILLPSSSSSSSNKASMSASTSGSSSPDGRSCCGSTLSYGCTIRSRNFAKQNDAKSKVLGPDLILCSKIIRYYCRREFRNQISDNMDRWKSRGGKGSERRRREVRGCKRAKR